MIKPTVISEVHIDNSSPKLLHRLKVMDGLIKKGKKRLTEKCQLFFLENYIIFRVRGSEVYVHCEPTRMVKISMYYSDLIDVISKEMGPSFKLAVEERYISINSKRVQCEAQLIYGSEEQEMIVNGLNTLNVRNELFDSTSRSKEVFKIESTGAQIHINEIEKDAYKAAIILRKYRVTNDEVLRVLKEKVV